MHVLGLPRDISSLVTPAGRRKPCPSAGKRGVLGVRSLGGCAERWAAAEP